MVQHLVSPPKSANCDDDLTGFLLLLQDVEKQRPVGRSHIASSCSEQGVLNVMPMTAPGDTCEMELELNALSYVAGYVCKVTLTDHSCKACQDLLLQSNDADGSVETTFIQQKLYKHCKLTSLHVPSPYALNAFQICQNIFTNTFDKAKWCPWRIVFNVPY